MVNIATAASRRNQAMLPITVLSVGALALVACITTVAWLALHGPTLVPGQDTRITAVLISIGSRVACLVVNIALIRSAWVSFLHHVLSGERISTQTLVGACRTFMSLGQLENYSSLPRGFKYHVIIAAFVSVAMTVTSASFRYESLALSGKSIASLPDTASVCNQSLITSQTGYFCTGKLNGNTTGTSWSYLEEVVAGGQGTVHRQGELGKDQELGANVTLGILPPGWSLGNGSDLPWMAISVTCVPLTISAEFSGSGQNANADIYVNGNLQDTLDIANMPEWGAVVHLYQQVNDSGPASSLSPWIIVMLARNLDDGTANFGGLAPDAVTYL